MRLGIVVGNPHSSSRTLALAEAVGDAVGAVVGETSRLVVDLIDVAPELFDPDSAAVNALVEQVRASAVLVVASPTYKAAYTGLLKAFLDRFDTNGLADAVVVPVMTGGSMAHSLAPDTTLRPLLVELGASVPTRSLYFVTANMPEMAEIVAGWIAQNDAALRGAAHGRRSSFG